MVLGISIVSIPFGSIIGAMQWIVLRKHLTNSGFWFTTSAVAMFIGFTVSGVIQTFGLLNQYLDLFLSWFFFGGVSGVLQWFIIRKQINYSGLWILVNVIAGIIAGVFLSDLGIIGGVIGWALSGILTGGMLLILFVNTKREYGSQIVA
jgi:serine/threonine-protein kinase